MTDADGQADELDETGGDPGVDAHGDAHDEATDVDDAAPIDASSATKNRLIIALGVAAVALAVLLVVTFLDRGRMQDELDRNDEIAEVASEFGLALYTYDYRDIDGQLDRMEELSTPSFAEQYRDSFEASLRAQIEERQIISEAELTDVLVSRSTGDQARAIVIASTSVTRQDGATATVSGLIDVSMLKVGGEWLVDKVLTIANDGSVTDAEGNPLETAPLDGVPDGSTSSVPSVPDDAVDEPAEDGE